jgi:hypothetical protein
MARRLRGSLVVGLAVAACLATAPASGKTAAFSPRPLFDTPNKAAYCWVDGTSFDDYGAKLSCWTPNDGFVAEVAWNGRRAHTYYAAAENGSGGCADCLRVLKGYKPRARVLRFGQAYRLRCRDATSWDTCSQRSGSVTFTCTSRSGGLMCTNTRRHGFWLGRFRGYRLF